LLFQAPSQELFTPLSLLGSIYLFHFKLDREILVLVEKYRVIWKDFSEEMLLVYLDFLQERNLPFSLQNVPFYEGLGFSYLHFSG
jgi:hypothetical protein